MGPAGVKDFSYFWLRTHSACCAKKQCESYKAIHERNAEVDPYYGASAEHGQLWEYGTYSLPLWSWDSDGNSRSTRGSDRAIPRDRDLNHEKFIKMAFDMFAKEDPPHPLGDSCMKYV